MTTDKGGVPPDDDEGELVEEDVAKFAKPPPKTRGRPSSTQPELLAGVPQRLPLSKGQRSASGIIFGCLLLLALMKVWSTRSERQAATEECTTQVAAIADYVKSGMLDKAEQFASNIATQCASTNEAELAEVRRRITAARAAEKAKGAGTTEVTETGQQALSGAAQDRRDGVEYTREDFLSAATLEKLEEGLRYAAANDKENFARLLQNVEIVPLKALVKVKVVERVIAMDRAFVRVHIQGTTVDMWTTADAIRDP